MMFYVMFNYYCITFCPVFDDLSFSVKIICLFCNIFDLLLRT